MLINAGAAPTASMLNNAARNNRLSLAAALIEGGAVPDESTLDYVRRQGWHPWEKTLSDAQLKSQKTTPAQPAAAATRFYESRKQMKL